MNFDYTPKIKDMQTRLLVFFDQHIYPNEHRFHGEIKANHRAGNVWIPTRMIKEPRPLARKVGLWNLLLPRSPRTPEGLSSLEYASLYEIMGRVPQALGVLNCSTPDTGDVETLERYAPEELKGRWLKPLLRGEIRSAPLVTEPAVASSGAISTECHVERQGDEYVISGRKWWSSGAGDPHCAVYIVMGKTNPGAGRYKQQSMIVVSANAPGITVMRPLSVFDYDDVPHDHVEVDLKDARMPVGNILLGEGHGLKIAQGRPDPGCIRHCMRSIGVVERALELMYKCLSSRIALGKAIAQYSVWHERTAEARCMIEQARLLTLKTVHVMGTTGNKVAKAEIAVVRVVTPNTACQIIDWAVQAYGDGGVSGDFPLALAYVHQYALRLADGPDEVHCAAIAKLEPAKHPHLEDVVDMPVARGA